MKKRTFRIAFKQNLIVFGEGVSSWECFTTIGIYKSPLPRKGKKRTYSRNPNRRWIEGESM